MNNNNNNKTSTCCTGRTRTGNYIVDCCFSFLRFTRTNIVMMPAITNAAAANTPTTAPTGTSTCTPTTTNRNQTK